MTASEQGPVRRTRRPEVRRQIILAAARVFGEKGIEASRLDDVATEAGFTRGAVYSNFSGKEDLVSAVIRERIVGKISDGLIQLSASDSLPRRAGEVLADQIRDDPSGQLLVLDFLTRAARDSETRERFVGPRREQRRLIAEALRQYSEEREVELPFAAESLAVIIVALVNGIAAEYMADPEDVPLDALPAAFAAMWPTS